MGKKLSEKSLEELWQLFPIFLEKHKDCCRSVMTCFSHESGIGTSIKMFCPKCGESKDITNYDNW